MACSDRRDNDGDRRIDCDDSGCKNTDYCKGHETQCFDGKE